MAPPTSPPRCLALFLLAGLVNPMPAAAHLQSGAPAAPGTGRFQEVATPAPGTGRFQEVATPAPGTSRFQEVATPAPGASRFQEVATPAPGTGGPQEVAVPVLRGEVRLGDAYLSEGTVVLHQVSVHESGEIDSVRVEIDGSFRLTLPHMPDHGTRAEIYFASVRHQGLYYFGPAITQASELDSVYTIQAFDTASVPHGGADLPLTARNLFLERSGSGWEATDVFQLRHDGDRTLYSAEEGVIWSYPLPSSARNFQVGQADLAPDAVVFRNGRIETFAPLPPGERFLVVRYEIPDREFLLPMPGATDRMEILVREPGPPAEFPPLGPATPLELEPGSIFRRYAGDGFRDATIQARVASDPWSLPAEWLGIMLAGLLGAAGVYGYRRRSSAAGAPAGESESRRDRLLVAIARLDDGFGATENPTPEAVEAYHAERARLLDQLKRPS
jgi:hypothetical protein